MSLPEASPQDTSAPVSPTDHTSIGVPENNESRAPTRERFWTWLLEKVDSFVYIGVGGCFGAAALVSLVYAIYAFVNQVFNDLTISPTVSVARLLSNGQGAQDIISFISDLLLTLIIMEVLGTVVHHLREGETTLKPFLFIGIISATRGILAVGARLSVGGSNIGNQEFTRDMVELGINAIVIIALGVAMKLIGDFLDEGATSRGSRPARRSRQENERN